MTRYEVCEEKTCVERHHSIGRITWIFWTSTPPRKDWMYFVMEIDHTSELFGVEMDPGILVLLEEDNILVLSMWNGQGLSEVKLQERSRSLKGIPASSTRYQIPYLLRLFPKASRAASDHCDLENLDVSAFSSPGEVHLLLPRPICGRTICCAHGPILLLASHHADTRWAELFARQVHLSERTERCRYQQFHSRPDGHNVRICAKAYFLAYKSERYKEYFRHRDLIPRENLVFEVLILFWHFESRQVEIKFEEMEQDIATTSKASIHVVDSHTFDRMRTIYDQFSLGDIRNLTEVINMHLRALGHR
eukprot:764153-Hanusia_phi.AAC.3